MYIVWVYMYRYDHSLSKWFCCECACWYTGVRIKRLAELPALEFGKGSLFTGRES